METPFETIAVTSTKQLIPMSLFKIDANPTYIDNRHTYSKFEYPGRGLTRRNGNGVFRNGKVVPIPNSDGR